MQNQVYIWEKIREIRASWNNPTLLKLLLIERENEFGSSYNELAERILAEKVPESWAANAARWNSTSLDVLIRYLWEDIHSIGKQDLDMIFQCSEDPHIVSRFNSDIIFRRSKTLMNGDGMCDHYYELKG